MPPGVAKDRTYVVTGAGSGIGAATARYLREQGGRVIACDREGGDVAGDLTTREGRAALVEGVTRLSGGAIDGIVANAGGGRPQTSLALNFFGAVATLEGLRPLLATSAAPRAVAVSSIASMRPPDAAVLAACLALDEPAAHVAAKDMLEAGDGLGLYSNAKHALNAWCRRAAIEREWCGGAIPLNVVALGFFDTPAARYILSDADRSAQAAGMVPMRGAFPAVLSRRPPRSPGASAPRTR